MVNGLSSIQITKEFKNVLRREKQDNESFEDYIKRLRDQKYSIEEKHSIEQSIDEKKDKEIETDTSHDLLFEDKVTKLCKEHNLPAQYNYYDKKWLCHKCIAIDINGEDDQEEEVFTNMADFNDAVARNKFRKEELIQR